MGLNPNVVPWMGLMGVIGLALAYGGGLLWEVPDPMLPAWWGLIIGVFVGLILRFVFRIRSMRSSQGEIEGVGTEEVVSGSGDENA
ncbi:MAG: hypothetical protein JRF33_17675 [Deltaproteobacteria bacterium]|nr:hypothetical protein [Deltaproteobacteria bacterium]